MKKVILLIISLLAISHGFLEDLNPDNRDTIFITSSETYDNISSIYNHICIKANGILTITDSLNFYNGADIIVENNGTLCVDAGTLNNANIVFKDGSFLDIKNGGSIKAEMGSSINIPVGVNATISHGFIINNAP